MANKAQGALEFLIAYSTAFLIIALVLAVLFLFVSLPSTLLPFACNFYSGFTCQDAVLSINGTSGAVLVLIASDSVSGVVRLGDSSNNFSATLNGHMSTGGYCAPNATTSGQEIYCIANFDSTPKLGALYSGTFDIYADFCASGISNSTPNCAAGSNYTYGGELRLQASGNSSVPEIWYAPIRINNTQSMATPPNFQQMITFNALTANTVMHERSDLGNIRFYYGSKELYSWCESNCSNSSLRNATFWVKIPSSIPAHKNITLQMYFLPLEVNYDGVYAGEAPQIGCPNPSNTVSCKTYAQHDNGASVFNVYDNFAGTNLSSDWAVGSTNVTAPGPSVAISNGLTLNASCGAVWCDSDIYLRNNFGPSQVMDAYVTNINSQGSVAVMENGVGFLNQSYSSNPRIGSMGGELINKASTCTGGSNLGEYSECIFGIHNSGVDGYASSDVGFATNFVLSYYYSDGTGIEQVNYTNNVSYNGLASYGQLIPSIDIAADGGATGESLQWVRTRSAPPNDVMPTQNIGQPVQTR